MSSVPLVLNFTLALILLTAAASKACRLEEWRRVLRQWGFVRPKLLVALAIAVPVVEASLGSVLLVSALPVLAAWVACGLFLAFAAGEAIVLSRGKRPPCGCFGDPAERVSGWSLGRSLILASAALLVALAPPGRVTLDPPAFAVLILTSLGLAYLMRIWSHVGEAVTYLVEPPPETPAPPRRVSVRHVALTSSLFDTGESAESALDPSRQKGALV